MYIIKPLKEFEDWLANLSDNKTRIRLARRLEKASRGLLGDVKPVGNNVYEMREFFGPGWRLYYIVKGSEIIVMLGGGNKSSQKQDIKSAIQRADQLED